MEFLKQFKDARRVSTPLVAVRTPDPASTIKGISSTLTGADQKAPILYWDVMRGMIGVNPTGKAEVNRLMSGEDNAKMATQRPAEMLDKIAELAEDSILFMANAQMYWEKDEAVRQGIWNLRDPFKARGTMFVMLTTAGAILPAELAEDVLVLDEPLPKEQELIQIVKDTYAEAKVDKTPTKEEIKRITDAVVGLAAFPAEQTIAMSLSKERGMNYDQLWERKKQAIEQTRGLSVWRGGEKFSDIGGVENAKKFFKALLEGKEPPRVIVFIDEIEKAFAGTGTDLSGVKTEMTGTMLTWMQDHNAMGSLFLGPPGAAKTMLAKAIGNEGGIPTIAFDFGSMQSSLVGSSGENLRTGLKVVEAVSADSPLFIGTCNEIRGLPAALRRRFTLGTFFFDLPTPSERDMIWNLYLKKYKLEKEELPNDHGWTGAEIRNCCQIGYKLGISLEEASRYIVPVAKSAAEEIKELRKLANNRYTSASESGLYKFIEEQGTQTVSKSRKFRVLEMDIDSFGGKVGEA